MGRTSDRTFGSPSLRTKHGRRLIRPISARYMHKKKVFHYESSSAQKDAVTSN